MKLTRGFVPMLLIGFSAGILGLVFGPKEAQLPIGHGLVLFITMVWILEMILGDYN